VRAAAVVAVLVVHNLVTNLWAQDRWYVRINLATAVLLVWVGGAGLTLGDPRPGVAAALVVLVVIGLATVLRPGLLADPRMDGVDAKGAAWRAVVRVPLGTVVLEEVAFRGVLPALVPPVAASALFGLWHILPTRRGVTRSPALIAAAVLATAVAGQALWQLRLATGGLAAPALVHAAANSGAVVAAYLVLRSRRRR
jgi:uncharacterized protein